MWGWKGCFKQVNSLSKGTRPGKCRIWMGLASGMSPQQSCCFSSLSLVCPPLLPERSSFLPSFLPPSLPPSLPPFHFWLGWAFVAVRGLSLVAVCGGYSWLRCAGFSLWWLLLLQSTGSRCMGFSSCGTRAQ